MQLADRLAAGLLDAGERLALALAGRIGPSSRRTPPACRTITDAVGDGVVELAGDPRALLDDGGAGLLLALALDADDVPFGGGAAFLLPAHDPPIAHASA